MSKESKNLVILGGGFAGTRLAADLEKKLPDNWRIYLLNRTNAITFTPLLPEVVSASVLPGHVQVSIRQMVRRTHVRMVTVDSIDLKNQRITYHNNESGELFFDQLVFAMGVDANTALLPGMQAHALPLKTVGDALRIRNIAIERLEQATIHPRAERRQRLMHFTVIGGGFSGVEVAGELEDFLKSATRFYKNVSPDDVSLTLVHGQDRLLPELPEKLGKKTQALFEKRRIDVRLNARAARIESDKVILETGESIATGTVICTIGTSPTSYKQAGSLPLERGRICVNGDMSVKGLEGIWALGDCALVPNAYDGAMSPPTAQFADRQASVLASNIVAQLRGKPTQSFTYKPAGLLASIGRNNSVAQIYGMRFSGLIAFMFWRGIYLLKVPTLSRKLRLFLEWNYDMVTPPDLVHLGFKNTEDAD